MKARALPRAFGEAAPDTVLFAVVATLLAIGLVMIFSASSAQAYAERHDSAYYLKHQALYLIAGALCAAIAYRVDLQRLRAASPYILVACFAGLLAVLMPHVGVAVNGARRWIGGGLVSFQPSEFAKLGLVIYLAAILAARGDRITSLVRGLVPLCAPVVAMALLILIEPDVGTSSLIVFTAFAMFFAAGARIDHLILLALAIAPSVVLTILANPYKRARMLAFLNPWKDAQNTGFHLVQSLLALGSGGLFGVGLGESRAKFFYLPEQYTDFIFSVLGEELGLIGTAGVVVLFIVFAYRSIRIAIASADRFGFFLACGCAAMVALQAFVNIGVVTSSWPVTGVPLPFISFGGSSLIVSLIAVGLILNVGRRRRIDLL